MKTPFFVTYLPVYIDYLTVEKGLARNSLSAYRTDLRHFGHWLGDQKRELDSVQRIHIVRYFQALRSAGISARSVARALAGDPSILLADEPTGNLDSTNGEAVMELLRELHRGGATICMVTHDPRYARYADRTIRLFDGRIVEESVGVA